MGKKLKFKVGDKVRRFGEFYYILEITCVPRRSVLTDGRISTRPEVGRPRKKEPQRVYYKINKKFRPKNRNKLYARDIYEEPDKMSLIKQNGLERAVSRVKAEV